jgi:2-polyprenyl-6-methoxyphenol hydroxylase-like FAD-dependent oxidoreductase
VLIVGGGVSGISAAAEFVAQGRSVVLIERNICRRRFGRPSIYWLFVFIPISVALRSPRRGERQSRCQ